MDARHRNQGEKQLSNYCSMKESKNGLMRLSLCARRMNLKTSDVP